MGGMLDSADDFAGALFNLLHGFYKQSIASLRNALETMILACECELSCNLNDWEAWQKGGELTFSKICGKLRGRGKFGSLEDPAVQFSSASIFPVSDNANSNAWARNLYQRLSKFSHARGDSTNGDLWESNGPIYSSKGMRLAFNLYLETYALLTLIAKVARDPFNMPEGAAVLYYQESIEQYLPLEFQKLCTFYHSSLFV